MTTYKIIRFYRDKPNRVVAKGLSLNEAQKHCQDPKTRKVNRKGEVIWFDGWTKE